MNFHDLHSSLPTWMSALETRLAALFAEEFSILRDAGISVVGSRGKRLRPVMLLLACAAYGEVTERAITNATLVELIHAASLVHDDVVDEADLRRGAQSARARWGNKFSILLGDFLLGRVFELATEDGDPAILRILAPTATAMGRGVILELSSLDIDADEEIYWRVLYGKTAVLFEAALHMGALLGGASLPQQQLMAQAGESFGYAFQLADDLMDLHGAEHETGKPLQADWRQQRATLPLLYAMRTASSAVKEQIQTLWQQDPFTEEHFHALRHLVEDAGGFEYGWEKVKTYLEQACVSLQGVPAGPGHDALLHLCTDQFPLPVLPSLVR